MARRDLIAARAKAETYKSDFTRTLDALKQRLKPANLASDAWHNVRDKGAQYTGVGVKAASERPGVAGGAVAALMLFLLRAPIARLIGRVFGSGRRIPGTIKAELLDPKTEYDLTASSVVAHEGKLK